MPTNAPIIVIGFGNEYRSDDGVGIYVARRIGEFAIDDVNVATGISDVLSLIETWQGARTVFLVDAVESGASPGTIHKVDAFDEGLDELRFSGSSSHSLSIARSVELARAMGRLPESMTIYGIEGENFGSGIGLSPCVKEAADLVITEIVASLRVYGIRRV